MLLTAEHVNKNYGLRQLLSNVSLYVDTGDKVGILGINGTGKSTLLRILAGREEPDTGTVTRIGNAQISFLEQNPTMDPDADLIGQILRGVPASFRQPKEYEAKSILRQLGFENPSLKIGTLSGGQKKRVALAAALLHPADVLILDEPTNHLDIDMINWLEDRLRRFSGGLVTVTHDRYFLNRVVNKITELERGSFYTYEANYAKYLELKVQRAEMEQASFRKRQAFLRREYEWISRGVRARGTKSRDRMERYHDIKSMAAPETDSQVAITAATSRLGRKIIELKDVSKHFGPLSVLEPFSYGILKEDRIGIVGKNGMGKSTLLNIIAGVLKPDSGSVVTGATVKIGYFTQESTSLPEGEKVIDYINDIAREIHTPEGTFTASRMLERFLFTGDMQHAPIEKLSGGEKRRLYLLGILMASPNVLLLDEPTNDLDIETLGILEEYLQNFPGPVLAVSHDRYFLDKIASSIFEVLSGGQINRYTGGYSDYEAKRQVTLSETAEGPTADLEKASGKQKGIRPPRERKLKFTYKEEQEYRTIEQDVAALEARVAELEAQMQEAAFDYVRLLELTAQKEAAEAELMEKMDRWVYLNELAERIEGQ